MEEKDKAFYIFWAGRIGIPLLFGILLFFVYHYSIYQDAKNWRCDKWRFNGLNQTRLISGTPDLTESDILAIQYYCDNVRPTSVYEKCQLLYAPDGSKWGFSYVLKNGTNDTVMIDREKDCVEWVNIKTQIK